MTERRLHLLIAWSITAPLVGLVILVVATLATGAAW